LTGTNKLKSGTPENVANNTSTTWSYTWSTGHKPGLSPTILRQSPARKRNGIRIRTPGRGGKIAKQANAEGNASNRVMQGLLLCGTELNLAS
jgi:hypothetical protein